MKAHKRNIQADEKKAAKETKEKSIFHELTREGDKRELLAARKTVKLHCKTVRNGKRGKRK